MSQLRQRGLLFSMALAAVAGLPVMSCREGPVKAAASVPPAVTFKPQEMADALHAVIAADREVYALHIVQRLSGDEHLIRVTENWQAEKGLPVPAQMMRLASESVQSKGAEFHYILRSLWPINSKNAPQTGTEKAGLEFVSAHAETNYYSEESLGGRRYFTAVYPDRALSESCVECHKENSSHYGKTFQVGDVMGGVIVRVPLEF